MIPESGFELDTRKQTNLHSNSKSTTLYRHHIFYRRLEKSYELTGTSIASFSTYIVHIVAILYIRFHIVIAIRILVNESPISGDKTRIIPAVEWYRRRSRPLEAILYLV